MTVTYDTFYLGKLSCFLFFRTKSSLVDSRAKCGRINDTCKTVFPMK